MALPPPISATANAKQKLAHSRKLADHATYIGAKTRYDDGLKRFNELTLKFTDALAKIALITTELTNIGAKYTALGTKLVTDIKADVVKYTGDYNAFETAYQASKTYTDYLANNAYFDTNVINTFQGLADVETEVMKEKAGFDLISTNVKNIIANNFNPSGIVAPVVASARITTFAQYQKLYRATYGANPPAGRWNTYKANGILVK